ncbi:uncharacterized protein LOC144101098 [Amblyomma americanum]
MMGIEPYAFTLYWGKASDDSSDSAGSPDFPNSGGDDCIPWCSCGHCEETATLWERACCRGVPRQHSVWGCSILCLTACVHPTGAKAAYMEFLYGFVEEQHIF